MVIRVEDEEIVVDGITYKVAALNEDAMAQLNSLRFVNAELARLQAKLAVYGTAKLAYERALGEMVPRSQH